MLLIVNFPSFDASTGLPLLMVFFDSFGSCVTFRIKELNFTRPRTRITAKYPSALLLPFLVRLRQNNETAVGPVVRTTPHPLSNFPLSRTPRIFRRWMSYRSHVGYCRPRLDPALKITLGIYSKVLASGPCLHIRPTYLIPNEVLSPPNHAFDKCPVVTVDRIDFLLSEYRFEDDVRFFNSLRDDWQANTAERWKWD